MSDDKTTIEEDSAVDVNALKAESEKWKSKAQNYEAENVNFKKQYAWFDGRSPDEIKEKLTDYDNMRKAQVKSGDKDFDALVSEKVGEMRLSVQKEIDERDGRLKDYSHKLKEYEVTDKVFSEAAPLFNDDCFDDVRSYIRRYCDKDADGNIFIKDDNGNVRYANGSASQKMTGKQFAEWLASQKPSWAKASTLTGNKNSSTTMKTNGGTALSIDEFSSMDRSARAKYVQSLPAKEQEQFFNSLTSK